MILPKKCDPGFITVCRGGTLTDSNHHLLAVWSAAVEGREKEARRRECEWQRAQLPNEIRDLVLDDQKLRNKICWFVFDQ